MVDPTGMHHYQPGYLYVALGQAKGHWLSREERTLLRGGVDLAIEEAIRIHPDAGTVQLDRGGNIPWDYLVIATGARLVPDQIPGSPRGRSSSTRSPARNGLRRNCAGSAADA